MDISSYLYAPATLPLAKDCLIPTEKVVDRAPELVCTVWNTEQSTTPTGNWTTIPWSSSPQCSHYTNRLQPISNRNDTLFLPVLLATCHRITLQSQQLPLTAACHKAVTKIKTTTLITHFLKFSFWHSTYAIGAKVCVSGLDASKAAQIFITLFLPFCNQVLISYVLSQTILIQFWNYT
jgi:hypothetical protein